MTGVVLGWVALALGWLWIVVFFLFVAWLLVVLGVQWWRDLHRPSNVRQLHPQSTHVRVIHPERGESA